MCRKKKGGVMGERGTDREYASEQEKERRTDRQINKHRRPRWGERAKMDLYLETSFYQNSFTEQSERERKELISTEFPLKKIYLRWISIQLPDNIFQNEIRRSDKINEGNLFKKKKKEKEKRAI